VEVPRRAREQHRRDLLQARRARRARRVHRCGRTGRRRRRVAARCGDHTGCHAAAVESCPSS
jgi:hypothetical protein